MFGDLEDTYSVIFGETLSAFWRKHSAILEKTVRRFWRFVENLFGKIVVGDLEKSFGDLGENCSAISYWRSLWSIAMLGDRTW